MRVVDIKIDPFNPESVDRAIKIIREHAEWVERTLKLLIEELVKFGENEAINRVEHIDTGETLNSITGYTFAAGRHGNVGVVVAGGHAVWIEFGTGVYYNAGDAYPERPEGIVGIGEYGQGKGNQDFWLYPTDDERLALRRPNGDPVIMDSGKYLAGTHGIPQNMFMWYTAQEMHNKVPEFARSLFV